MEDLRGAVTAAKQAPLRALMVRAEGKIFSGGADVRMFKGRTLAHARERVTSHLRTIADLEELRCPTVAAVQGLCLAAGLELALACDLIWAGASARFAQAEASIGTTTLLGGVQRLAERAGPSRAREIIYEGETRAFAARLANGPTLAYAAGRRIVRAYLDGSVRAADKVVDEVGPTLFESADMKAGVTALLDHGPRGFRDKVVFEGR